jgi:hypothetical protein
MNLSETEIKRMFDYFKKIETAEILVCEDHDLEYISGEECPACQREQRESEMERRHAN